MRAIKDLAGFAGLVAIFAVTVAALFHKPTTPEPTPTPDTTHHAPTTGVH